MFRDFRVFVCFVATALSVVTLRASSPKFFQAATQADFLKGEVESLTIDSHGDLMLGPATELVFETATPFLWALVAQPDGTLFIGSGNDGKVFKVDPQGKGAVFFDSTELEVHALAPAPSGGVYVGTSPDGKIYKVDRDGKSTTFYSGDDKYIWALASDARGNLFAGTGDKGVIYKITPDGTATTFYKTNASHATALAFDKNGNLIVGTGTSGKVLRIDPTGKAFVLLDSPFQEIRALRFDDKGMLYVAAISGRAGTASSGPTETNVGAPSGETARAPVPSVSAEITSISIVDVGSSTGAAGSTREDHRTPKGAVYRITPDGVWDQLWESRDDMPYDLVFDPNGTLMIGTGNKGKIYRLEGEPLKPTLVARANAQQVTSFYKDPHGRLYYATANPGKLFRFTSERAAHGTYESEARDAQTVSTWGTISWRSTTPSGTRIELFTRSGNTETPDDTWSNWSSAYTRAEGTSITSPKARYLQWRAVMTGTKNETPVLTSVMAAYLQRNLRPIVRSITVHPPGIVFQKPFSTGEPELAGFEDQWTPDRRLAQAAASQQTGPSPALGRRAYQKGLQTVVWKADDENDDELVYDVMYRREGESTWKVLRKAITESILVWDTTTVPTGTYFVKIVASDAASNPLRTALAGELESSAFDIDTVPPEFIVKGVRVDRGRTIVSFDVKDDHSPVLRVEFSQDGLHWRGVFPVDGIADSREEHYELAIEGELSERGLTLRAADSMNNVATAHVDAPKR
jgi:sugar lactone lactonase YvrE